MADTNKKEKDAHETAERRVASYREFVEASGKAQRVSEVVSSIQEHTNKEDGLRDGTPSPYSEVRGGACSLA